MLHRGWPLAVYQVHHTQSTTNHGLGTSVIGRRAMQIQPMCEWSKAPSQLHATNFLFARPWVAPIASGKGHAYTRSVSPVDMKMT